MSRYKPQLPYTHGGNPIGVTFAHNVQDANGVCVGQFHQFDQAAMFVATADLLAACRAVLDGNANAEKLVRAAVEKAGQLEIVAQSTHYSRLHSSPSMATHGPPKSNGWLPADEAMHLAPVPDYGRRPFDVTDDDPSVLDAKSNRASMRLLRS